MTHAVPCSTRQAATKRLHMSLTFVMHCALGFLAWFEICEAWDLSHTSKLLLLVPLPHIVSSLFIRAGRVCHRLCEKRLMAYLFIYLYAARCSAPALLFEPKISTYVKHGLTSSQTAPGHHSRACTLNIPTFGVEINSKLCNLLPFHSG